MNTWIFAPAANAGINAGGITAAHNGWQQRCNTCWQNQQSAATLLVGLPGATAHCSSSTSGTSSAELPALSLFSTPGSRNTWIGAFFAAPCCHLPNSSFP
jgi:hypothetical protein